MLSYYMYENVFPKTFLLAAFLLTAFLIPRTINAQNNAKKGMDKITVSTQKRLQSGTDSNSSKIITGTQQWDPGQTAIIICDMWDQHWCKGATTRVAEMAPRLNEVISSAREKGMLIVHAPSECIDYYKDHPARTRMLQYSGSNYEKLISDEKLETEQGATWPVDQSDEGCDDLPKCSLGNPWRKQIAALEIKEGDAISDSGAEIAALFEQKGIKNVILTGVHTNMCVIGRSFGLRNMVRLGKNVVLMRDMTDAMYNSRMWPVVNHFAGVQLVVDYIEKYVCPTILSTDITGSKKFRFKNDKRPANAAITPKEEYFFLTAGLVPVP